MKQFINQRIRYASKGFDYYRLNTSNELKILLPFLYISNLVCLLSLIAFIKDSRILYLIPLLLKSISDYWICYIFSNKINERFELKTFIGLTIIHPIYISLLGIISPLINYQWKNDV